MIKVYVIRNTKTKTSMMIHLTKADAQAYVKSLPVEMHDDVKIVTRWVRG